MIVKALEAGYLDGVGPVTAGTVFPVDETDPRIRRLLKNGALVASNANGEAVEGEIGIPDNLAGMRKAELLELAQVLNLDVEESMTKAEIIEKIEAH